MADPEKGIDPAIVDEIVQRTGGRPENTIAILGAIQQEYNYLPRQALKRVCRLTGISPARLAGVSTFYTGFRHMPSGRHRIRVCIGTACHVKGAETVFNSFRQYLDIHGDSDTDADGLFTVEKVACLGCCMLAPAVQIDNLIYGHLDNRRVPAVIRDFLRTGTQQTGHKGNRGHYRGKLGEVRICTCSSCQAAGAGKVYREWLRQVDRNRLPVKVTEVGCTGISYQAPLVTIIPAGGDPVHYGRIHPRDVTALVKKHFPAPGFTRKISGLATGFLERLYLGSFEDQVTRYMINLRDSQESLFRGRQHHLATRFCGQLDPLDLDQYQQYEGFEALKKVLADNEPADVIGHLEESALRGRGGAGYGTASKWKAVRNARGNTKYVICNGDEGDPGAFMDRMILESFPFRVIEGMLLAGYTTGAHTGYLYIRSEYPLAVRRMRQAIELCMNAGLLGDAVMDFGFSFHLQVVEGAGAFVCGEETALIAALEGKRGVPVYKPPYPSAQGLWDQPTLVNNVETFALIPWIILNGGSSFAGTGTRNSTGTKSFALAGKINNGGLIEVPMGITLHEIIYDIGGGIQENKNLKAVQVGGPSGGCVPASLVHTPVDFDALNSAGAIMGSGGMVVLDETDCMVDIARYFMEFTRAESCGKCTYCRIGTTRMLEILNRLTEGRGRQGDIEKLEHLSVMVKERSVCGLGKTAPNPVLSTIRHFRDEYTAHINGQCPAKKCKALVTYYITDKCIGCSRCARDCPVTAVTGEVFSRHEIDRQLCIKCGTCRMVCPEGAVNVE